VGKPESKNSKETGKTTQTGIKTKEKREKGMGPKQKHKKRFENHAKPQENYWVKRPQQKKKKTRKRGKRGAFVLGEKRGARNLGRDERKKKKRK